MSTLDRDKLAALIDRNIPDGSALKAADAILARWRLAPRWKCKYKSAHEIEDPVAEPTCCGFPVIPWEEESYR